MDFISTRGEDLRQFSFRDVLYGGLARDGGLYLPNSLPQFSAEDFSHLSTLPYPSLFFEIVKNFLPLDDLGEAVVKSIIKEAYADFTHPNIAPLNELDKDKGVYLLELFHSPTFAFKDYALQFLGKLFQHYQKQESKPFIVLGATSGDTGSAAIQSFKSNVENAAPVFILYPHNRISPLQRKQMTTVKEKNIHTLAIEGNFDDCQNIVKELFLTHFFSDKQNNPMNIMSVNSINWVRIMAQIPYYFSAYFQSKAVYPEKVIFSVPTGNFGNILAGYLAKKMGLPIEKLVLGCNENDILHRFISNNDYSIHDLKMTPSPSMDIVISSNLERYLYLLHPDPHFIKKYMEDFKKNNRASLPEEFFLKIKKDFLSHSVSNEETLDTIKKWSEKTTEKTILDPHTAVAMRSLERSEFFSRKIKKIVLSTAHPAKFIATIEESGNSISLPSALEKIVNLEESVNQLPNNIESVQNFIQSTINK